MIRGDGRVEEVGVTDPVVHQVDVGPQGERGVGVAEPACNLLHVAASLEQQAGAGVPEGVARDPRQPGRLGRGDEHPAPQVAVSERQPERALEHALGSRPVSSRSPTSGEPYPATAARPGASALT